MGFLHDGLWHSDDSQMISQSGAFERKAATLRNWITPDGAPGPSGTGGFRAQSGRYHLYVADACPWAHRTRLMRALKGLETHITMDVVHPDMMADGWSFDDGLAGTTGDTLFGSAFLREIYVRSDPQFSGRVTVPVLWDKQTGQIVSNESAEIIQMFDAAFDGVTGNYDSYRPEALSHEIETVNTRVYNTLNNGVYKAGFARSQSAYETAARALFETLDWLEARLETQDFVAGDVLTEADIRLLPTLLRFDAVYYHHFKCNLRSLSSYRALSAYTKRLYALPGVAQTFHLDNTRRHYFNSHRSINPFGIIPLGPALGFLEA